jgi:hypothetical protein
MDPRTLSRVGLVGYGEVGRILAEDLRQRGVEVAAFDLRQGDAAMAGHAAAHGVTLAASLQETFPAIDWNRQGTYFFQRVIQHGRRRAEEVREVAETVREAGLEPWSASGTAQRQDWMADLADGGLFGDKAAERSDWRVEADCILGRIGKAPR